MNCFLRIFLITITFSTILFANIQKDKIYNVAVFKNWMPYYSVNNKQKPSGFAVDIFEEIAKDIGIKYTYIIVENWNDFWPLVDSGKVDIIPDISATKNRKKSLLFSDPTNTFEITIYKRATAKKLKQINDFYNKTVAVVNKNVGVSVMKRYPQIKTKVFDNRFDAFYALLSGEVDGICYPRPLTNYSLRKLNLDDKIIPLSENLFEIKRSMGVISHNIELVDKINQSISKIKENRRYAVIYKKWFEKEKNFEFSYEQIFYLVVIVTLIIMGIMSLIIFYGIRKKWLITEKGLKQELDIRTTKLEEANEELKKLARIDYLTNIFNRRHFFDISKKYFEISKRNNTKLCIISLDLDKFKAINDTYGHKVGDMVLIEFTKIVDLFMRKSDLFGRIGGEEFSILLQNTTIEDTLIVSEKIRKKVESTSLKYEDKTVQFTVSMGIVQLISENTVDELLEKSDLALYQAKENGRNTIVKYDSKIADNYKNKKS
ncbi:GGDEF domain-containing protein [uncultured Arcobacter sp.]|uniref:transporter substrate-binding domain-containing diguanylate cyclase n=1 Tax=uncultured Arcobacter sp. TaxID=165434 RepID=UPI002635F17D|nr:GGDEF domain-containing protein [uncultured Arcobacter sp.]